MAEELVYGRLIIVGKEKGNDFTFVIDKTSVLLGRDPSCDIRIVNKEISRKHAEIYVDDDTSAVFILSMGREPVRVNGKPVTTAQELFTGDHIEVLLDGRSREFVFEGEDDTVEVAEKRQPLGQLTNSNKLSSSSPASKPAAPPPAPPPPPPPPPKGTVSAPPPAPPLPPTAKPKLAASTSTGMPSALQDAIKAGIQLRKVNTDDAATKCTPEGPAGFVPNPADLLKLKAGLRKTENLGSTESTAEQGHEPSCQLVALEGCNHQIEQQAIADDKSTANSKDSGAAVDDIYTVDNVHHPKVLASNSPAQWTDEAIMPTCTNSQGGNDQAAAKDAKSAGDTAPSSEMRMPMTAKKRVRWAEAATPEGAKDATMTIHLRKGDLRQVINVEADNTVAFSQWALGSLEEEVEEQLPATVTCKKARRDSSLTAPSSAGKTPMHSALRSLFGNETMTVQFSPYPPSDVKANIQSGAVAPAPTPTTGAKPTNPNCKPVTMDTTSLAAKLLELAREHDVTLELPAGCQSSPKSAAKEPCKVLVTPKSCGNRLNVPAPGTGQKQNLSTGGKSRLAQACFMEDMTKSAGPAQQISFNTVPVGEEGETPKLVSGTAQTPCSVTPASRCTLGVSMAEEPPRTLPRSTSKTPRIVIFEKSTSQSLGKHSSMKPASHSTEAVAQAVQTIAQMPTSPMDVTEAGKKEDLVSRKQYQKTLLKAKAYRAQVLQLQTQLRKMTIKVAKLTKAATSVGQVLEIERNKRMELQVAMQQIIRNSSASEEPEQEYEENKFGELSSPQSIAADAPADSQMKSDVKPATSNLPACSPKVVVVRPSGQSCNTNNSGSRTERAGAVYVVRPGNNAPAAEVIVSMQDVPSTVICTSAKKTPMPSARIVSSAANAGCSTVAKRQTAGLSGTPLVVNNIELPVWLFPEDDKAVDNINVSAELAEAVRDAEATDLDSCDEKVEEAAMELHIKSAMPSDQTICQPEDSDGEGPVPSHNSQDVHTGAQVPCEAEPANHDDDDGSDAEEDALDEICHICGKSEEGDVLLLCDSCDNGCHLTCCDPPLKRIPKGDWFCVKCLDRQQTTTARSSRDAGRTAEPESVKKPAKPQAAMVSAVVDAPGTEKATLPSSKPSRGRRASVAPSPGERGTSEDRPMKATRSRRASVAPGTSQLEDPEPNSLKPSRAHRASMAAAATQARSKRDRGAVALDAISEEIIEEEPQQEDPPKSKKSKTAGGKEKPSMSEKTATRTTRARAAKEDGEGSIKKTRQKSKAESASVSTRSTRSRR